ncbi:relaxase/mobilization nuclease domain-containing protein [Pseudomonas parafulva]|uniref:relaxase/mobilization nuclease domain-containing protein n=1 Tax=Pseudomonas parafulva TaxID=157782 RepID=UPI00356961FF
MIIHRYLPKPVTRIIDGKKRKVQNKARSFHYKLKSAKGSIIYLLEEKEGAKDKIESIKDRGSYIYTNCSFVNPTFLAGTSKHKEALYKQAESIDAQLYENFLRWAPKEEIEALKSIQNMEGYTEAEKNKAMRSFYAYEMVMSFRGEDELTGLNRGDKAKIISEIYEEFRKEFTNSQKDNFLHFGVVQFDTDQPHNQFFLNRYSLTGQKLSLHEDYERIQKFIYRMEHHPIYGNHLAKIVTPHFETKNLPDTMEEKYDLQKQIEKCFSKDVLNFEETHKNLIANKIILDPKHNGNKLKEVLIKRKGQKTISSLGLEKKYHIAMSRYFELKTLSENHPKYSISENLLRAKEIIGQNKGTDIEALDSILNKHGFGITANVNNKGEIKGYSLVILELNDTLKLSTLAITTKEITANPVTATNVRRKYLHLLSEEDAAKEEYKASRPANVSPWGKPSPFYKKRKRITDYPTLHEYMADAGGMYDIALKSHFSLVGDTLYDKRRNVEKIRIVEQSTDNLRTTVLASDRHTAKAVAQLYLDSGYKGFKITDGQANDATSRNLWREGTLLGLEVQGYVPTQEDKQWLAQQIAPKLEQVIATNLAAIEAYKSTGAPFQLKMLSNQWTVVDRSAVAYAFVDLMKHNLDPMLVLNPPAKKKLDDDDYRFKGAERDLVENYELILKTVADECPEKLELAREQLKPYSPAMQQNKIKHKA